MATLSAEQTLSNLASEIGLNDRFFEVVELVQGMGGAVDFSKPVVLSGIRQNNRIHASLPLRKALVEEALSGRTYAGPFFKQVVASRVLGLDPEFFSPSVGTDLREFLTRISADENHFGFVQYSRGKNLSDEWARFLLETTPQDLGEKDRLLDLARSLVENECETSLKWLLEARPELLSMTDSDDKFWPVAKASKSSAWVWDALMEAGADPFAPQVKNGKPLWRVLVPQKTTVSTPEGGTLRARIEEWIRNERKNMPSAQRVLAETYLIEAGLQCLTHNCSDAERSRELGKTQAQLNSLPAQWVNHVPSGSGMPAALLLLFRRRVFSGKGSEPEYEGLKWAQALDKNPVWTSAMSPYCALCVKVFLAMHNKKDLVASPPSPEECELLQSPEVYGFFKKIEGDKKAMLGVKVSPEVVLAQLKSHRLAHKLPAPSSSGSHPRF